MTFSQLVVKWRSRRVFRKKPKARAFDGGPHRKGVIYKVTTMSPRKPNSSNRTFAKVRLLLINEKFLQKFLE